MLASTSSSPKSVGGGSAGGVCSRLRLGAVWKALRLEREDWKEERGAEGCDLKMVVAGRMDGVEADLERAWRRAREAMEQQLKLRADMIALVQKTRIYCLSSIGMEVVKIWLCSYQVAASTQWGTDIFPSPARHDYLRK